MDNLWIIYGTNPSIIPLNPGYGFPVLGLYHLLKWIVTSNDFLKGSCVSLIIHHQSIRVYWTHLNTAQMWRTCGWNVWLSAGIAKTTWTHGSFWSPGLGILTADRGADPCHWHTLVSTSTYIIIHPLVHSSSYVMQNLIWIHIIYIYIVSIYIYIV